MDIVFVVDDSKSMDEEQANLAVNFPKFSSAFVRPSDRSPVQIDEKTPFSPTSAMNSLSGDKAAAPCRVTWSTDDPVKILPLFQLNF